ncbi:MAG: hypothetical protein QOH21_2926 [Acidobacteriota bacterium]|jgi:hypothetical protein|nr:hypothetical protein [Acidobacteriota bacterium]
MTFTQRSLSRFATLLAVLLLSSQVASAQGRERKSYRAERLEGTVRVDGNLDDPAWQKAPTFELAYETRPAENGPAPVRTEGWMKFDGNNLYVALRAHDPEPARIRARYSDRDAAFNDDFIGIVLDTFNDQRRAFEFFVNPVGVQMDLTQNEMTGNEDSSWDAIWESAGRITATGYEIEMRIPFSSLRFPATSDEMTWGLDVVRNYPRTQGYRLGLQPLSRGNNCYLCQSSALVGLQGARPARSIELDPTVTSSQSGFRGPGGAIETESPVTEAGLTAQWGITPNMTLNGTINPDFSQVEADAAELAVNTQFALFFPEKRPFFLEGADIFETRFNAIYSRNIADPEYGIKLTGKTGKNAFGAIVAVDRQTNLLIPSSQGSQLATVDDKNLSTILRYRRDLFGSTTGGVFYTGREGDGYHNRMLGGDILFRWRQTEAFRLELMGSTTQYPEAVAASTGQSRDQLTGHALRAVYQHTSRDWTYYVLYRDVAKGFRADLGFVPQVDFRDRGASLERAWYPEKRAWSQVRLGTDLLDVENQDGQHLQRRVNLYSWAQGPRQSFVRIDVTEGDQFYVDDTFNTDQVTLFGEVQALPDLYVSGQAIVGDQVDFANVRQGERLRFDPGVRWNAGRHLRLNFNHSYETLDVDGGRLFTANLTEVRATYQFNNRTFVRWIGQHLDLDRDPELYRAPIGARNRDFFNQLLFSYKINPLTVLFLGYSDTYAGNQSIDLAQQSRTLFLKVGYAWQV